MSRWQDQYLEHLATFPRPSDPAFGENFARARAGSDEAQRVVMASSLWTAWEAAKAFEGLSDLSLAEMVEEANAALQSAWRSFHGEEATDFIEYSRTLVRERLLAWVMNHGPGES